MASIDTTAIVNQYLGIGQDPIQRIIAGTMYSNALTQGVGNSASTGKEFVTEMVPVIDSMSSRPAGDKIREATEKFYVDTMKNLNDVQVVIKSMPAPKSGMFS